MTQQESGPIVSHDEVKQFYDTEFYGISKGRTLHRQRISRLTYRIRLCYR
ncbi:MAG: hypothetical protein ACRERU_09100 [Methylococcales bacterium]